MEREREEERKGEEEVRKTRVEEGGRGSIEENL